MVQAYAVPLSERIQGPIVAVTNHDDDILIIETFAKGQRTGHYNSCPGCFDEDPSPEDLRPEFLAMEGFLALGEDVTVDALTNALNPEERYVFALYAHEAAVDLFELPPLSVGLGYRYITRGEFALPQETRVFGGVELPRPAD